MPLRDTPPASHPTRSSYGDTHAWTSDRLLATHASHLHRLGSIDAAMATELSRPRRDVKEVEVRYTRAYLAMHPEYTGEDAHEMVSLEEAERRREVRDWEGEGLLGRFGRGEVDEFGGVGWGAGERQRGGEGEGGSEEAMDYERERVVEKETESETRHEHENMISAKAREKEPEKLAQGNRDYKEKEKAITTTDEGKAKDNATTRRDKRKIGQGVDWDAILLRTGGARDLDVGVDDDDIDAEVRRLMAQHARQISLPTRRSDAGPGLPALAKEKAKVIVDLDVSDEVGDELGESSHTAGMRPSASSWLETPSKRVLEAGAMLEEEAMSLPRPISRSEIEPHTRVEADGSSPAPHPAAISPAQPSAPPPPPVTAPGQSLGRMPPALPGFPLMSEYIANHAPPPNPEIFNPMFHDSRRPYVPMAEDIQSSSAMSSFGPGPFALPGSTRHGASFPRAPIRRVAPPPRGYFGGVPASPPKRSFISAESPRETGEVPKFSSFQAPMTALDNFPAPVMHSGGTSRPLPRSTGPVRRSSYITAPPGATQKSGERLGKALPRPTRISPDGYIAARHRRARSTAPKPASPDDTVRNRHPLQSPPGSVSQSVNPASTAPAIQALQSRPPGATRPPSGTTSLPPQAAGSHPSSAILISSESDPDPHSTSSSPSSGDLASEIPLKPLPGESDYSFLTSHALLCRLCFHRHLSTAGTLQDLRNRLIRWDTRRRQDPSKQYPPKYEQWEIQMLQALATEERKDRMEFAVGESGSRRTEAEVVDMIWRKRRRIVGERMKRRRSRIERRRAKELRNGYGEGT